MPGPSLPFDSLVLWAVCRELREAVGLFVEKAWQADEYSVALRLGRKDGAKTLLISCDPQFCRVLLVSAKPPVIDGTFSVLLKERLEGAKLVEAEQVGFDRALRLRFAKGEEEHTLIAELFGGRANVRLLGPNERPISRLRKIVQPKPGDSPASLEAALRERKGLSKLLAQEVEGLGADKVLTLIMQNKPVWLPGVGAYPFHPMVYENVRAMAMASMSGALEKDFEGLISRARREAMRAPLERGLHSRQQALLQMNQVLDTAARARELQMQGELLLAHQTAIPEGAKAFPTEDYESNPIEIMLDPEKTPLENAEKFFDKAKRAKRSAAEVRSRFERMEMEISLLHQFLDRLETEDPDDLAREARAAGLLRESQVVVSADKAERRFEGHRIRETEAPGGYRVLWGENATANDYLTTRIAKPNDYWLHVRGAGGSHVVLQTGNKPERVQPATLRFAAQVAARHSGQKHAHNVPVSYTLAKYVRKPRKAAPGAVTIVNDKTLFVD